MSYSSYVARFSVEGIGEPLFAMTMVPDAVETEVALEQLQRIAVQEASLRLVGPRPNPMEVGLEKLVEWREKHQIIPRLIRLESYDVTPINWDFVEISVDSIREADSDTESEYSM